MKCFTVVKPHPASVAEHYPLQSSGGRSSCVIWYWFAENVKYTDPFFVYCWCKYIFLKSAIHHRGMWELVKVVLWYIYSCQSVTSWDSEKINSWDVASYHLQYQGAHTPVMQAIQFYLIYPKPIQAVSQH